MSAAESSPHDDVAARWAAELRADAAAGNSVDRSDVSWMTDNPDRVSVIDWAALADSEPPPRFWHLPDWLGPHPTLFAGGGGKGKTSIAQGVATALAVGLEYVTAAPTAPVNVLFWACEDDQDELWRRQVAINHHLRITMQDLRGRLYIDVRRGLDNTLFTTAFGQPAFTALAGR